MNPKTIHLVGFVLFLGLAVYAVLEQNAGLTIAAALAATCYRLLPDSEGDQE